MKRRDNERLATRSWVNLLTAGALAMGTLLAASACSSDDGGDEGTTGADTGSTTGTDAVADTGASDIVEPKDEGGTPDEGGTGTEVFVPLPDTGGGDEDVQDNTPPASCREAILCQQFDCLDDTCKQNCIEGADQGIVDQIAAVNTCLETSCTGDAEIQCLVDSDVCYTEFQACFMESQTGDKSCEDAVECYAQCGSASKDDVFTDFAEEPKNPECEAACLQSASPEAQQDLLVWAFCVVDFCKNNPHPDCQKQGGGTCSAASAQCTDT